MIGASDEVLADFADTVMWDRSLVPERGLYVYGQIKSGTGIKSPVGEISGRLDVNGSLWVRDVEVKPDQLLPSTINKLSSSFISVVPIPIFPFYLYK